jgi:hypothetical protein
MGVCVGEQMLFDVSEEGDTAGPGPAAGQGGALPARRPPAARRLALQGAADGLEPREAGAVRTRCGKACRRCLFLLRAQLLRAAGRGRATASARPTTARPSAARSRAKTSSRPSSTPRKARPPACAVPEFRSLESVIPAPSPNLTDTDHAAHSCHRPQRRSLRSPQTGRYGTCHRFFRRSRPTWRCTGSSRARAACTWST